MLSLQLQEVEDDAQNHTPCPLGQRLAGESPSQGLLRKATFSELGTGGGGMM